MSLFLVADIGGTKIDFALVDADQKGFVPVQQGQLTSAHYNSCAEVVRACLAGFQGRVDFASLAVAGPVADQQVTFTNLPWHTGAQDLQDEFGLAGVVLANDLVALAESVDLLGDEDLAVLKPGTRAGRAGGLVVAPGTGLGAALLLAVGTQASVQATEAGHFSFSPRTELEEQLLAFLRRAHDHVSFEMVCSGTGLENIVSFLASSGLAVPEELAAKRGQGSELAALLTRRALAEDLDCPLSRQTYALFFDILAEFCGNLALTLRPGGALYLGGGMLPRLKGLFDQDRFVRRFRDRGKMTELVAAIPILLISQPRATLLGAWQLGRRTFYDEK